ncbi:unnamed protein product [Arctogadus glacialis]
MVPDTAGVLERSGPLHAPAHPALADQRPGPHRRANLTASEHSPWERGPAADPAVSESVGWPPYPFSRQLHRPVPAAVSLPGLHVHPGAPAPSRSELRTTEGPAGSLLDQKNKSPNEFGDPLNSMK